jgi:glycosyltransferase involved in cell wall biosynthesis
MSLEFALFLKTKQYDLIWVQWPSDVYASRFYSWCHLLGMPVAHTVHNILPHEARPEDEARYRALYRKADVLVVHSHAADSELRHLFSHAAGKIVISRIGAYTMFRRDAAARHRMRAKLNVTDGQALLLFFGGIRPYKNIDAVLTALCSPVLHDAVLVVAGRETGYLERASADPLAHTRARADELGVLDRLRFLPGRLDLTQTADLFEASDIMALPYVKSYGSAALLLGMTFGKHIVATRTGGMDEYLAGYQPHTLLSGFEAADVTEGIARAMASLPAATVEQASALPHLAWSTIAGQLLAQLNQSRGSVVLGSAS